jgi:hypothetical protein
MATLRKESLKALAAAIELGVPKLVDRTYQWPKPNHLLRFPSLGLVPAIFRYKPEQATEVHDPAPDRVIVDVGIYESVVQLKLQYATVDERAELEEAILGVFLNSPLRSGILLTPVTTIPEFGSIMVAWSLDDGEWGDEMAFLGADKQFESTMTITGEMPALAVRLGAYRMTDLRIGMSADVQATPTDASVGHVRINSDGSVTAL